MRELVRTNDMVLVSAISALLDSAEIHHLVLDQNMSVIEGSLGILPRRILVHEDDNRAARRLLSEAGVACLNGASFGAFGEGYLRFSYANSLENLMKAAERIREWAR